MKPTFSPDDLTCPLPFNGHETVQLGHGSGGRMMNDLIRTLFIQAFSNPHLNQQDDCATLSLGDQHVAFSTDSFVVDPLFFPGGDIGELAVYGTVNDLAMSGAKPLFLSVGLILEEGFSLDALQRITRSMQRAAEQAGVAIVTGDTKVVHRGACDKLFINTTGLGIVEHDGALSSHNVQPGDFILLSGNIAERGTAILSKREGLSFETPIESDTAPLHDLVAVLLEAGGSSVHALRDPTRGGVASALNEFAMASQVGIRLREDRIPVQPPVAGACAFLGLDPLHVANEGKLLAVVAPDRAEAVLEAMRQHPLGRHAALIGDVAAERPGRVTMQTRIGGWRMVDMLAGEQLPRIC